MAKQVTKPPRATAVATVDDGASKAVFGVVFNLNGTPVPVSTADVANAVEKGVDFRLPEPVDLGTIADFTAWLHTQFGVDVPAASTLPAPLDSVVGKLTSLDFTVKELHIVVPGTKSADQTRRYTIAMQAMWPAGQGISLIPGVLTMDGVFMGATNEKAKS